MGVDISWILDYWYCYTLDLSYENKSDSIHTYQKEETRGGFVASKDLKITFKNNFFSVKQDLTDKIRKSPISK